MRCLGSITFRVNKRGAVRPHDLRGGSTALIDMLHFVPDQSHTTLEMERLRSAYCDRAFFTFSDAVVEAGRT